MEQSLLFRLNTLDQSTQLIIACLFGILLGGLSILISPIWTLVTLLGLIIIVMVPKRPEFAILFVITLLSTVIAESQIPVINFGPFRMFITEPVVIGMLLIIIIRWAFDPTFRISRTPMDLPLIFFILWAILSTVNGLMFLNLGVSQAISEVRIVGYYVTFFMITNLISKESNLKLLIEGFFFLATIVAMTVIIQYVLGIKTPFLSGRVEILSTEGYRYSDVTRITDIVGEAALTVAFITKAVSIFVSKPRFRGMVEFIQWVIIGMAFIMNFNRAHWVSAIVAILITIILVRGPDRQQMVIWIYIILLLLPLIFVPVLFNPDSTYSHFLEASAQRLISSGSENTLRGEADVSTLAWRSFEYQYAWPQIFSHPLFGLGLGASYRPPVFGVEEGQKTLRHYIHNGHMWVLLKTGFVGYFFLSCFSTICLWRGFKYWRLIPDSRLRGYYLGFTLAYLALLMIATLHPTFMTLFWVPIITLMMGVNEVMIKLYVPKPKNL